MKSSSGNNVQIILIRFGGLGGGGYIYEVGKVASTLYGRLGSAWKEKLKGTCKCLGLNPLLGVAASSTNGIYDLPPGIGLILLIKF